MLRADRGGWPYGHPPNADFVLNTLSPQARGLLAWYPLGPGQYGITRDALNRHNLTPYAGPVRVGGSRGAVASFTKASSQYLAHAGEAFLDYPFTLACWFRYLTTPNSFGRDTLMCVSDRDDGYDRDQIDIYNQSTVQLEAFTTTNYDATAAARIDSPALVLGTWYHATAVFAAAASRTIYLNANQNNTNTTSLTPTTRDTIAIGAAVRSGGPAGYVGAEIADARIYNRALALAEIKQLYRNPWELYQPIVRWWVADVPAGGADALTADSLATGAPVLGTPTIAQTHALTAAVLATDAPVLATPTLGQEHALAADGLAAGTPALGTPTLAQANTLAADSLATGAPVLGMPDIAQTHALAAENVAAAAPTLGTPDVGQEHALTASALASGSPMLGEPTIGQAHALAATGITTDAPALGTPALGQAHALLASGIATDAPALGAPVIGQEHALTATGIATGEPTLGEPTLGIAGAVLSADSLAAGAPVLGTPTLGQTHALVAHILMVGIPLLGMPTVGIAGLTNEWRTWNIAADTRAYDVTGGDRSRAIAADSRTRKVRGY